MAKTFSRTCAEIASVVSLVFGVPELLLYEEHKRPVVTEARWACLKLGEEHTPFRIKKVTIFFGYVQPSPGHQIGNLETRMDTRPELRQQYDLAVDLLERKSGRDGLAL